MKYGWVTDEIFDRKLEELVGQMTAEDILAMPGVYEIVSEELNNEVLSALEAERDEEEEE